MPYIENLNSLFGEIFGRSNTLGAFLSETHSNFKLFQFLVCFIDFYYLDVIYFFIFGAYNPYPKRHNSAIPSMRDKRIKNVDA